MARTFRDDLELIGACDHALKWVGDKTLEQAYEQFDYPWWAYWLITVTELSTYTDINKMLVDEGFEQKEGFIVLIPRSEEACAFFRKRYPVEVVRQAFDEYVQGVWISLGKDINEILVSLEQ